MLPLELAQRSHSILIKELQPNFEKCGSCPFGMSALNIPEISHFAGCSDHLTEPVFHLALLMHICYHEKGLLQSDFFTPSLEDPSSLFSCKPMFGVLVQKSPSLQDIDLVEPWLEHNFQPAHVHFVEYIHLKIPVLYLFLYVAFPQNKSTFLSNLINMRCACWKDHLLPFSPLYEFPKTFKYQLSQVEHPHPIAEAILLAESQPFSEHVVL